MDLKNSIGNLLDAPNRQYLEQEILPGYLKKCRWFSLKDEEIKSIQLLHAHLVNFDAGSVLFCEINIKMEVRIERYQLPLGLRFFNQPAVLCAEMMKLTDTRLDDVPCVITDAFCLDVLPIGLLKAFQSEQVIKLGETEIRFNALLDSEINFPNDRFEIRYLSAEQSNSSLVINEMMIMKLIRRVMKGINPEVEMVRYLTENHFEHTPPLLGEVQNVRSDGTSYSMYVVQKFIRNQGDAWEHTLSQLRATPAALESYCGFAAIIGRRLGELHDVLSRPTDNGAFIPHAATEDDILVWAVGARRQLQYAIEILKKNREFSPEVMRDADFVLNNINEILAVLPELARFGVGSLVTRIHGDFHLGQVLVSEGDAFIIDFEGEPSKPLEVRRAKSSPMRDVAGLLRSFDYAFAVSGISPEDVLADISISFMNGYETVLATSSCKWVNSHFQKIQLLDLFLLEKCAYEICYEAANRPGWLGIPLRGFVDISSRILQSGGHC